MEADGSGFVDAWVASMPFFMQTSNVQQSIKDTRNIIGTSVSLSQERWLCTLLQHWHCLSHCYVVQCRGATCLKGQPATKSAMKNCVKMSQLCWLWYIWKSMNSPSMICACIQNENWRNIGSGYVTVLHSAYMQALASLPLSCLCLCAHRWLIWGHKLNLKSWKWLSIWQVSTGCYACF